MKKTRREMFRLRMFRVLISSLFISFAVTSSMIASLAAQESFSKKEISIIVNYGTGGARDIIARGIAPVMSRYLAVPMVIINEPGGGGAQGLINLYRAAADGYTIGIGSGSDITNQVFQKQEYDYKRFTHIGRAQSSSSLLFVRADSPFRSIKDFKSLGGPVRLSAFSLTSNSTVACMVIANRENFPLVVKEGYKSAADGLQGLIRGEVEFSGSAPSTAAPFVKSGQIRPILTLDQKRSPDFPETSTVAEMGHPDLAVFTSDMWLMGPPGLSKDRVKVLEAALMKTLEDPEFLKWAKEARADIRPLSSDEVTQMVFNTFGLLDRYKNDIEIFLKKK